MYALDPVYDQRFNGQIIMIRTCRMPPFLSKTYNVMQVVWLADHVCIGTISILWCTYSMWSPGLEYTLISCMTCVCMHACLHGNIDCVLYHSTILVNSDKL